MISKLKNIYNKELFNPGVMGLFINPFYVARKGLRTHITGLSDSITGKTLDIGCGLKPYEKLFNSTSYTGVEIDSEDNKVKKKAEYYYDGKTLPFNDNEYDSIIFSQVFEHVFNPDGFLQEVNRVLKKEGKILLTVPFVWDEHEQPYDYARYSSFGLKSILIKNGFEIISLSKSINDIRVITQLINAYIYKKTRTNSPVINTVMTLIMMSPFNILGEIAALFLPKNNDLYLDNIVLAKKIRNV